MTIFPSELIFPDPLPYCVAKTCLEIKRKYCNPNNREESQISLKRKIDEVLSSINSNSIFDGFMSEVACQEASLLQ